MKSSTNGKVERFHRTFNSMLAKACNAAQNDWSEHVRYLTFCYNTCAHASTGLSPFFLMHGQMPRHYIDICLDNPDDRQRYDSLPDYARDVTTRLENAYRTVRTQLELSAQANQRWYDKKVHEVTFQPGQQVRIFVPRRTPGKNPKLECFYKSVATILQRINNVTYLVACDEWRDHWIVHADKLKPVLDCSDGVLVQVGAPPARDAPGSYPGLNGPDLDLATLVLGTAPQLNVL